MKGRNLRLILIAVSVMVFAKSAQAEDTAPDIRYNLGSVIVSATKTEIYQTESGSSTTVITGGDIEKSGARTVADVLRQVPGITLVSNGAFGGSTTIYTRGTKPGYTLVMIDGIELNDPISTERSFDFAHLSVENIERIEIVRGPQTTLYGSDAIGGVINIITRKGKGKPKFSIYTEGGSHRTRKENFTLGGSGEKINYSFSLSRFETDGVSKAYNGSEKDAYENTSISSRLGYAILDDTELSFTLRFTDAHTDLDDGRNEDDPNYIARWRNFASRIEFSQAINNRWDHRFSFSLAETRRKNRDEADEVDTSDDLADWYKGRNFKFEWQNNFQPFDWDTVTFGVEYEEERGSSHYRSGSYISNFNRTSVNNKAYYLQSHFNLRDSLFIIPGIRYDRHSRFGSETTYRISTSYILTDWMRLKATAATGFKAPALYQLYSDYGDPSLRPDESKGYDFGFEYSLSDNLATLGVTFFHNNFKNMIAWDSDSFRYKNIGRAKTEGFEIEAAFSPLEKLTIKANYTNLKTKDKDTGLTLARRPRNQADLNFNWQVSEKSNLNLDIRYMGSRWDDTSNTRKTKHYAAVNLSGYYDINENITFFARIEDILDREFCDIYGYGSAGRSFYSGIKMRF